MGHASDDLVDAYIAALPLVTISIVLSEDHRRSKIEIGAVDRAFSRLWFKPSHLDLLLGTLAIDGWAQMPAAELLSVIQDTAGRLGAAVWTEADVRRVAAAEVAAVTRKIGDLNTTGGLKDFNKRYKAYRRSKAEAGERAMPYSAYLASLTKKMVEEVARLAG